MEMAMLLTKLFAPVTSSLLAIPIKACFDWDCQQRRCYRRKKFCEEHCHFHYARKLLLQVWYEKFGLCGASSCNFLRFSVWNVIWSRSLWHATTRLDLFTLCMNAPHVVCFLKSESAVLFCFSCSPSWQSIHPGVWEINSASKISCFFKIKNLWFIFFTSMLGPLFLLKPWKISSFKTHGLNVTSDGWMEFLLFRLSLEG